MVAPFGARQSKEVCKYVEGYVLIVVDLGHGQIATPDKASTGILYAINQPSDSAGAFELLTRFDTADQVIPKIIP